MPQLRHTTGIWLLSTDFNGIIHFPFWYHNNDAICMAYMAALAFSKPRLTEHTTRSHDYERICKGILILGSPRLMYWSPFSVLGLVFQKPNCPSQLQVDMSNGSLLVAVCMLTCSILQTCLHVLLYSKAVYSRCLPVIVYIRKTTDTGPQYPENDF